MGPGQTNIIAQDTGHTPTINTPCPPHIGRHKSLMAYARTSRYRRKPRYVRRRRPVKRTYAKRRTYRRPTRPRVMNRKALLNITSEKKKDDMLYATNVVTPRNPANTAYLNTPAVLQGGSNTEYAFLWVATGRENQTDIAGGRGTKLNEATRTSSLCYMRGLKERIELITTTSLPWQWRRICFTSKGDVPAPTTSTVFSMFTSNGYQRVVNEITGAIKTLVYGSVYDGTSGSDWIDPMIAKVDTQRVTLKYDKVRTIATGNQSGMIRMFNMWHPMNKNLRYDDDETGGGTTTAPYSVTAKEGMGDYYVMDLFRPLTGSATTDLLTFAPQATLYWHER